LKKKIRRTAPGYFCSCDLIFFSLSLPFFFFLSFASRLHFQAIQMSVAYNFNETLLCSLLPFNAGLWHGLFACIYVGMRSLFVSAEAMSDHPLAWLTAVHGNEVSVVLTIPDHLEACLAVNAKEFKAIKLHNIRQIMVKSKKTNPELCVAFTRQLRPAGIGDDVVVPILATTEGQTMAHRRPGPAPAAKQTNKKKSKERKNERTNKQTNEQSNERTNGQTKTKREQGNTGA
jgi:acyl-coenzyme A synthetase/AMP-(fatty) acid ligase